MNETPENTSSDRLFDLAISHSRLATLIEALEKDVDAIDERVVVLERLPGEISRVSGDRRALIWSSIGAALFGALASGTIAFLMAHVRVSTH